ncbi:MAG: glycosyltransferase family 4 protein [Candidatus Paceibacterota bacterium]|jgi:glycosyltransferase involved in cell wall biosynthesis
MRLLICTQIVDSNDANLGFFHRWLEELAPRADELIVVCLKKGDTHLPGNVRVMSLGKEAGTSRMERLRRLYRAVLGERYDAVFVHMNPEYAILGGLWWRITGKKVLLWYTHKAVNWRLRLGALFATKIFTASPESCRLRSGKVEVVGHGIPTDAFLVRGDVREGEPLRLLSVGRIAPVKDLESVLLAMAAMKHASARPMSLDIVGEAVAAGDKEYEETLHQLVARLELEGEVHFAGAKTPDELPAVYASHHLLVHTSKTGSIDKVVLEALASGLWVVTTSEAYGGFEEVVERAPADHPEKLAQSIEKIIRIGILKPNSAGIAFVRERYALPRVIKHITDYFHA